MTIGRSRCKQIFIRDPAFSIQEYYSAFDGFDIHSPWRENLGSFQVWCARCFGVVLSETTPTLTKTIALG